jgi:hypothetical protein
MPMVNHFWRDADEPWVKVSGETRPLVARWIRSSPTAAAASRASAVSVRLTLP